jgi:uncharacterized protein
MTLITMGIGLLAGVLSGLLGIGGGAVLVPLMVFVLGITQHTAQGVSLLVIIPTAMAGVWRFHQDKLVDYRMAAYLAAGSVLGMLVSANFVQLIDGAILKKIFGIFVLIVGARMIFPQKLQQ